MRIRNNPKLTLLILFAVFFVPYFGAVLLYKVRPNLSQTNNGALLKPTIPLADLAEIETMPRQWYLVHVLKHGQDCDAACQKDIITTRQVRIALNGDSQRLHRLVLSKDSAEFDKKQHPDLLKLALKDGGTSIQDGFYIADPRGQIILYYGEHIEPKPIYKDLKRLLQYG